MKLFQLTELFQDLKNKNIEDEEVFKDTLDSINTTINVKCDNIATLIENNNADLDWISKKIKELQQFKKSLQNKNKWLMDYMASCLDEAGIKSLHTDNHILKIRNYKASVNVTNEALLPAKYMIHKVEEINRPDKQALYQALKNGEKIDGAELEPVRKVGIK